MALDGLAIAALSAELKEKLTGGRVDKIYQPDRDEIFMHIRQPGETLYLVLSAHPQFARVHLIPEVAKENPAAPPAFCMLLRKHLERGRILRVEQPGLERILHLHVESVDEVGERAEKVLIAELMGKHSNIILIDASSGAIFDGIKRVTAEVNRYREVLPGVKYLPPPGQGKANPLETDTEYFRKVLLLAAAQAPAARAIADSFQGVSPQIGREVLARAGLPPDLSRRELDEGQIPRLWGAFKAMVDTVKARRFSPVIYLDEEGQPSDFSAIVLVLYAGGRSQPVPSISAALESYYARRDRQQRLQSAQMGLLRVVDTHLERSRRKLQRQTETMETAASAEDLRIRGELITANIFRLKKGLPSFSAENFYGQGEIQVVLDPRLTPAENAQSCFKRYNKAKKSLVATRLQVAATREEISYLEQVKTSIQNALTPADLNEIREELAAEGYLRGRNRGGHSKKTSKGGVAQPLRFTSSDGMPILVGRNNRQNDQLTLRTAFANDLWLHTKEIPGSHVIVRTGTAAEVPPETLKEAAMLAAYYSQARASSQVPVDYTLRKHVRKPADARPGMVIYDHQHTIYVTPDAGVVARLAREPSPKDPVLS
ncbi:MAG: NFACT family protein [Firmicutes bacterium]|nr:NFACT family protein [Bacillota bacterium]